MNDDLCNRMHFFFLFRLSNTTIHRIGKNFQFIYITFLDIYFKFKIIYWIKAMCYQITSSFLIPQNRRNHIIIDQMASIFCQLHIYQVILPPCISYFYYSLLSQRIGLEKFRKLKMNSFVGSSINLTDKI